MGWIDKRRPSQKTRKGLQMALLRHLTKEASSSSGLNIGMGQRNLRSVRQEALVDPGQVGFMSRLSIPVPTRAKGLSC